MFCVATIAGAISCGNNAKTEETSASNSQAERDYDVSGSSSQSTQSSSRDSYQKGESADKLPMCNTKWSFVDAQGDNFMLIVKEMARDGKSAKIELEKNGTVLFYGTVSYFEGYYKFSGSEYVPIYYSNDGTCHSFNSARWDYDAGYLYQDSDAYNAESPKRLKLKKVK